MVGPAERAAPAAAEQTRPPARVPSAARAAPVAIRAWAGAVGLVEPAPPPALMAQTGSAPPPAATAAKAATAAAVQSVSPAGREVPAVTAGSTATGATAVPAAMVARARLGPQVSQLVATVKPADRPATAVSAELAGPARSVPRARQVARAVRAVTAATPAPAGPEGPSAPVPKLATMAVPATWVTAATAAPAVLGRTRPLPDKTEPPVVRAVMVA